MNTLKAIASDFPAGAAFICGFCVCLLIFLLLLKQVEWAQPKDSDDEQIE